MTIAQEEVKEGNPVAEPEVPGINAQVRARARTSLTLPSLTSLRPATQRVRSGVGSAAKKAQTAGASAAKAANTKDSLIHSQPPTFAQTWQHHMDVMHRHEALLITVPYAIWAVIHTFAIKPLLNLAEWITARPLWTVALAAVVLVLKFWG